MAERRLADLPGVLADMAEAADKAKFKAAQEATKAVKEAVDAAGGRYRIKKVRLGSRSDVKTFGATGGSVARGRVVATPGGFWTWVEEGTRPHFIVGRHNKGGKRGSRKKRISVAAGSKAAKAFGGHATGSIGNPLHIPGIGWREYAHHPGAKSQGHPWPEAMAVAARIVPQVVATQSTLALAKAFK